MANSKALVKRQQAGALVQGASYESLMGPKAAGAENVTAGDLSIPRLYMLQPLSPQVSGSGKLKGAAPGMIFDSVTQKFYEKIWFIVCLYRRSWVEWVERDAGGGFVAEHFEVNPKWKREERGPFVISKKESADGKPHIINDTRSFFSLYSPKLDKADLPDNPTTAIQSLTSTQIRRASNLLTVITGKEFRSKSGKVGRLPIFASVIMAEGEESENDQGTWYSWKFTDTETLVPDGSELLERAVAFYKLAAEFKVTVPPPQQDVVGDEGGM